MKRAEDIIYDQLRRSGATSVELDMFNHLRNKYFPEKQSDKAKITVSWDIFGDDSDVSEFVKDLVDDSEYFEREITRIFYDYYYGYDDVKGQNMVGRLEPANFRIQIEEK